MKRQPKIYDFHDFVEAVSRANSKNVKVITLYDFYDFKDCSSIYKLNKQNPRPYLKDMVQVMATRGENILKYKTSFSSAEFTLNFLRANNFKNGVPFTKERKAERGISEARKKEILTKLGPIMPKNRSIFWENLPVNDEAVDLLTNIED